MTPLAAQGRSGGKSDSAKGAPKKAAKAGTKKGARTPSKKKKGGFGHRLLLAFAAGLALACLGFWMLRDIVEQESPRVVAAPQAREKNVPPDARPAESKEKSALPKEQERPFQPAGESGREVADAVESALADLQSLAYEEGPVYASFEERIRQVDYALMQATWLHKLPARAMRLTAVEERARDGEYYRFQTVDILPGKGATPFVETLKDSLALWGEGASLKPAGRDAWDIVLDGIQTHSMRLYPGQASFPAASGDGIPGASAGMLLPSPELAMPRMRTVGEEPKLAIVIDDLGLSESAVRQLLDLNYPVTCAFLPHGKGREILVHQPMEPIGYPRLKPGPNALLTGMSDSQIRRILDASIAAVPHAVGLNNHMGSKFTQQTDGVNMVVRVLKERGLFMLDSLTHKNSVFVSQGKRMGIEHYSRNVFLDASPSREKILEELRRAERIALFTGQAVAIGHPLPETLGALKDWQYLRNREVRIVRLSELRQDK
jgi:hypothetical protein